MTQQEALTILKTGANVYLTGSAGSGKTFVLQHYIAYLKIRNIKAGITASTGVAATHIGGMTLNSWAGVGIKKEITDADLKDLLKRKYLHNRFKHTQVLIIDEISMLPSWTLEAVDKVLRVFKRSREPFGGIQVVLCGDFFQLPPIDRDNNIHFVYKSPLWEKIDLQICYLDRPYRQDDPKFLHMLDEIRTNTVTNHTWNLLKERFLQPLPDNIVPTKLYTHNEHADTVNDRELDNIQEETHVYTMKSSGSESLIETMKKSCLAPEVLELKKGALVMFVKNNFENEYVNGTMGTVIDLINGILVVETFTGKQIKVYAAEWTIEEDGEEKARLSQLPLRLAWAITIHKSQGMTLDAAEIDLGKSFVCGLGYVALTRVRTLQGIR